MRSRVRIQPRGPRSEIVVDVEHNVLAMREAVVDMAREQVGLPPREFARGEVIR